MSTWLTVDITLLIGAIVGAGIAILFQKVARKVGVCLVFTCLAIAPFVPRLTSDSPTAAPSQNQPTVTVTAPGPSVPPTTLARTTSPVAKPKSSASTRALPTARASGTPLGTPLSGPDIPDGVITAKPWTSVSSYDLESPVSISGHHFNSGWAVPCSLLCDSNEDIEFYLTLSGKYHTLDTFIGITDDSVSSGPIQVRFIDRDRKTVLYQRSFTRLSGHHRSINVTGVLSLDIEFRGPLGQASGALGAPVLH